MILPAVYVTVLTGFALRLADVLRNTRYPSAVVAVNEPAMELTVVVPKIKLAGCVTGDVQFGRPAIVVVFPSKVFTVKYFMLPVQILLTEKT